MRAVSGDSLRYDNAWQSDCGLEIIEASHERYRRSAAFLAATASSKRVNEPK